jgi:hypothetical protein
MRYALLFYQDQEKMAPLGEADRNALVGEYLAVRDGLVKAGRFAGAARLQPTSAATSVRVREGKALVTDGPFAELKEQLAGFFLIEADDLDQAVETACQVPAARLGTVEVRPVIPVPEPPQA